MVDFTSLAATARRLIDANGRSVTLTKQGKTPSDSSKPWRGQASPAIATVTGVGCFVAASDLGRTFVTEDQLRRGNSMCLFAANNTTNDLLTYDQITDGTQTWKIVSAQLLKPADTAVMYAFEVER